MANNLLEALGDKYKPTKILHNYMPLYWRYFREVRHSVKSMLEIGVGYGTGLAMWAEFFPNAHIYAFDVNPESKKYETDRIHISVGDQSDPNFLKGFAEHAHAPFDIIIDDGCHKTFHQLTAFSTLFPLMSEKGIYVVEDIGTSAEGEDRNATFTELKRLVDNINYWPMGYKSEDWPWLEHFPEEASWWDKNVLGVSFYRYIAFIMKGRNPEDSPFLTSRIWDVVYDYPPRPEYLPPVRDPATANLLRSKGRYK